MTDTKSILCLRTCNKDGTSYEGFKWPLEIGARVEAPDWDPDPERSCGGGLHGLPWGEGDGCLLSWDDDAVWMVYETADALPVKDRKCRCKSAVVRFVGDRKGATDYMREHGSQGRAVVGATVTAGDGGAAIAGEWGTATAGNRGMATARYRGTATAGNGGYATAGDWGTATAGDWGTATAGCKGTAAAGHKGIIVVDRWDGKRFRLVTGYVGEDGIKADTPYRLDADGKFMEVKP